MKRLGFIVVLLALVLDFTPGNVTAEFGWEEPKGECPLTAEAAQAQFGGNGWTQRRTHSGYLALLEYEGEEISFEVPARTFVQTLPNFRGYLPTQVVKGTRLWINCYANLTPYEGNPLLSCSGNIHELQAWYGGRWLRMPFEGFVMIRGESDTEFSFRVPRNGMAVVDVARDAQIGFPGHRATGKFVDLFCFNN